MEHNYLQMKKYKIEIDESQLELISKVLDFYSRIGMLQLEELLDHPTVQKLLEQKNKFQLKEGSITNKGEVIEVGSDSIKVRTDDNEIKDYTSKDVSFIDYTKLNKEKKSLINQLIKIKDIISNGDVVDGYYGVYSEEIDNSCVTSYDLHQQFRHEIWANNPNRKEHSLDSRVYLTDIINKIKIEKING